MPGATITFNVDADYQIVRTQLTKNIVAVIEGSDPQLKGTYVAFGAHDDHVGYAEGEVTRGDGGARRAGAISYAAKGVPIIFFTTGLHPDYHANTDEVSKIEFDKLTRITQMVFETGLRVANLDHAPARDNKGPRAGRLTQ